MSKVDRHNMLIRYMNKHNIDIITLDEAMELWGLTKNTTRQLLIKFDDFENTKVNTYKYKFLEKVLIKPTRRAYASKYIKQRMGDISGKRNE